MGQKCLGYMATGAWSQVLDDWDKEGYINHAISRNFTMKNTNKNFGPTHLTLPRQLGTIHPGWPINVRLLFEIVKLLGLNMLDEMLVVDN